MRHLTVTMKRKTSKQKPAFQRYLHALFNLKKLRNVTSISSNIVTSITNSDTKFCVKVFFSVKDIQFVAF